MSGGEGHRSGHNVVNGGEGVGGSRLQFEASSSTRLDVSNTSHILLCNHRLVGTCQCCLNRCYQ